MGSNVNLGARLEAYTRNVNANIVISDSTFEAIKDKAAVIDIGKVEVKGFSEAVQAYGLKSMDQGASVESLVPQA